MALQSRGSSRKLLNETLELNETVVKTRSHLVWGVLNTVALSALVFNITRSPVGTKTDGYLLCLAQKVLVVFLTINAFFHFIKFSINKISMRPVCLSPRQTSLFGLQKIGSNLIKTQAPDVTVPKKDVTKDIFTAMYPMNLSINSCLSPTSSINEGINVPTTSPSTPLHRPTPHSLSYSRLIGQDSITDEGSLTRFLEAVEEEERRSAVAVCAETSPSAIGSLWSSPSPSPGVSPLLLRTSYQVSPTSPATPVTSPVVHHADDGGSPVAVSHTELWRRCRIDPHQLTQWNANLRMWVSLTILQRVVAELDHIDAAFVRCGLSDMHLGSVGLDRLKRTASIPQVVLSIPSLPRLVPFLELSQHQEYLVARIRELARGGSMSEYRWNSGGTLHGKPWEEHLPTDSALVMHLITTYLDIQLMAPSQRADTVRPFSSSHVIKSPERPPAHPHGLIIYQRHLNPPHFLLVDREETYEVPPGRNNVFHTFLLFLHLLKTKEHGMLGPLNLGRSGVNVLWVVDS